MGTIFVATATAETFVDFGHVDEVVYEGGPFVIEKPSLFFNGAVWLGSDANFIADSFLFDQMLFIIELFGEGQYDFIVPDNNEVDYSHSNAPVQINMNAVTSVGRGGFAEGDVLVEIFEVIGSAFNDVIRGSDIIPDGSPFVVNGVNTPFENSFFINNPGDNVLVGGGGSDVLEGRSGADVLVGGTFTGDFDFDYASYESSPAAVTVRLRGIGGSDTQTAIATGGDATGDVLVGIEGLIGSRFGDTLTGNSLDNILAGGLGSDVLDGKGGTDTADYSRDHFFDLGDTADQVVVRLGLNGASGTGQEFKLVAQPFGPPLPVQVSTDTLFSIENVTGTAGNDTLVGNERDNVLDGRGGNDSLDGGFGNDTLIGGPGNNTAAFFSHDLALGALQPFGEQITISLGLNGADGHATRSDFVSNFGLISFQVVESDTIRSIENVTGSNRSETIIGNGQDNVLEGRGGNDTFNGGAGNDTLNGGAGNDTYDFRGPGQGNDRFFDTGGTDKVLIDSIDDILFSKRVNNEHDLQITVKSGTSTSTFTAVNQFAGSPIETVVDASGKSMVLATGFLGGDLPGIISGTSGDDSMDGRGGDDFLFGNGGNDHMLGGTGNDRLDGGEGNDVLDGGPGDDILTGGKGHDTFVFAPMTHNTPGSGNDIVTDFVHGQDHLDFRAFDTSFRDLKTEDGHGEHGQGHHAEDDDRITMHVDGHDTVLEFAGGSVRITGVTQLHADDFFFEKSSSSFTGTVAGLSGQDAIDFVGTGFGANSTLGYSGNPENSGGTLSVGDGVHMANIALLGSYMASSFAAASGGQGGTLISEAAQASTHTPIVTQPHA